MYESIVLCKCSVKYIDIYFNLKITYDKPVSLCSHNLFARTSSDEYIYSYFLYQFFLIHSYFVSLNVRLFSVRLCVWALALCQERFDYSNFDYWVIKCGRFSPRLSVDKHGVYLYYTALWQL